MRIRRLVLVTACAAIALGAEPGLTWAQHLDVLVQRVNDRLVTGSANFDTGQWELGRRVYSGEFDGDFAVNSPGYNSLGAGSPSLPPGSQALPGNGALEWDFLPMMVETERANLFYWNGLESDGVPGITPDDVQFGALPGPNHTLGLFDQSNTAFAVSGSPVMVAGGVIDDAAADGFIHRHRFYQLLDNDGSGATQPTDGIYLFAMRLRMAGLVDSQPIYMAFGTPGSSVAALDSAAVPWLAARADTLIGMPGDYNVDGSVDAADYVVWRSTVGSITELAADGDFDGLVGVGDYGLWRANFGVVAGMGAGMSARANFGPAPEPNGCIVALIGLCGAAVGMRAQLRSGSRRH